MNIKKIDIVLEHEDKIYKSTGECRPPQSNEMFFTQGNIFQAHANSPFKSHERHIIIKEATK